MQFAVCNIIRLFDKVFLVKQQTNLVCISLFCLAQVVVGFEPPTKFSKKGAFTGPQFLEGGDLFQGVAVFT